MERITNQPNNQITMTTEELKQEIDGMSYESLLSKWRFAPIGDPMFVEEVGNYYKKS